MISRLPSRAALTMAFVTLLALLAGCANPSARSATKLRFDPPELPAPDSAGPTLRLSTAAPIPIADFMYFVPLISPEPVSMTASPGNTQQARVTSIVQRVGKDSFSVECEFEVIGTGSLLHTLDQGPNIQRNEKKLAEGGTIERALDTISIDGPGAGVIEVEGVITNGLATVSEVRLRFNARGQSSPVSIGLKDLRLVDGAVRSLNEHIARVNTLTFRRAPGSPRMTVTVASVKRKDAGGGLWSKFTGAVTGMAANMFLKPIKVDATGHEALLNFGRQLAAQTPSFTFPRSKNLKDSPSAP
jgi:hypothetical protein